MDTRPFELERYIKEQHRIEESVNYADYKPTYQSELNEITKRCDARYKQGLELISSTSEEDLKRCVRLYRFFQNGQDYESKRLIEVVVDDKWVLVPRYVSLIEKMRALKEILK